ISGGTFGLSGAVSGDPSTAIGFNGSSDYGAIPLNLSSTHQLTVEFWLKWNGYANNDSLAMELTPNFNEHAGGFLVDPDAPQFGGTFGVALGSSENRYSVFFARPSAGVWHHYVLVLNAAAPAGNEIAPYVDGQAVSYQIGSDGSGEGAFANSTLYLMSRDGSSLFGAGDLQDLAIYNQPLSEGQAYQHVSSEGTAQPPHAAFTVSPSPVRAGESVTLNAGASSDSDAKIVEYQWALNGNGNYETSTGSPTLKTSFATPGTYEVSLRVVDEKGVSESVTHKIEVGNFPPVAKLTASPNPAIAGQTVTLSAAESTDQGTITGYKWDLEGKGTYETSTGTTPTITNSFASVGAHTVGVEVTDDHGLSTRTTLTIPVLEHAPASYSSTIERTPGVIDFYKLGETAGPTIKDSVGASNGTISGGTFGLPGAVREDSGTAIGFNGTSDSGAIPLNLSGTSQVTVEFWLKWSSYADNDSLAMELTPNFNENDGGFLVDPNASQFGGTFGVAIGPSGDRDAIYFQRPSAGVWHHYAFVLNSAASAGGEVTPYVDGQAVSYQQEGGEAGQGAFANSTLYLMSRDGSALFGAGDLQYLAIYDKALSASTIFQHYYSYGGAEAPEAPSEPPMPTPTLSLSGASGDTYISASTVYTNPQASSSGGFTVTANTGEDAVGIKSVTFPTLTGFSSGGGTQTALTGQTSFQSAYAWSGAGASASGAQTVTATDNKERSTSASFAVVPDTTPPSGGALKVNGTASSATGSSSYSTSGGYTIERTDYSEAQSAAQAGLASSTLTVASATLAGDTCGTFGTPTTIAGSPAQTEVNGCYRYTLTGVDHVGNSASISTTVMVDATPPSTPTLAFSGLSGNTYYNSANNTLYFRPASGGAFTVTASSSDADTGILGYTFSSLAANGITGTQTAGQEVYAFGMTATQPASAPTVSATNNAGGNSANASYNLVADTAAPTGGALTVNSVAASAAGSSSYNTNGSFTIGARTEYGEAQSATQSGLSSSVLTRATGTLSANSCGKYGTPSTITGSPAQSGLAEGCYLYTLTGTDNVGNVASIATTVKVDRAAPVAKLTAPTYANGPVSLTFSATDPGSGVNAASGQLKRAVATYTTSTNTCGTYTTFTNIGPAGPSSPYTDSTVSTGHCYAYEYQVSDNAGNASYSSAGVVKVDTSGPALTSITDTTPGSTAGLPQVGDAITLQFSDMLEAATVPSAVTLTYSRTELLAATQILVSGLGSGAWSAGDTLLTPHYSKTGGTSAVVTASTALSGESLKLTVTKVSDPSGNLTAGGPGAVSGTLGSSLKDVFGNKASTGTFTTSSVKLF
ncbi:MAG TPA: LamG-like jellyroll fold domain-containing protein, partial [Solirubrobacteraceae bacterium]|nr:LamG-like jellyroll fold domain-containing protein [Solirubrobacteraceae bacterium]